MHRILWTRILTMKDINDIENFIQGKMSANDAANFKSMMDADASLRSQVGAQADTLDAINEYRKNELKGRLSNITVGAGLSTMHKALISGAAALVLLAGYGSYEYFNTEVTVVAPNNDETQQLFEVPLTTSSDELEAELLGITESEDVVETTNTDIRSVSEETTNEDPIVSRVESNSNVTTSNIFTDIDAPISEEINLDDDSDFNKSYDNEERGDISSNGDNSDIKGVSPTFKEPHAHKLSYNWNNDNLTLFGKFNKSEPYLLIDLADSKELYLKYQGDFYKLEESTSQKDKSTLESSKVTDPFLIRDLIKKSK